MGIAMDKKYCKYRNDTAGSMHIALATTVAMVRGNARTTKKDLRASFDILFRHVLKTAEEWAAANPASFRGIESRWDSSFPSRPDGRPRYSVRRIPRSA